jgi:hypothetical protein
VFRCDSGLRVGGMLEVRIESAERKARQLFGAGSAEILRGRGADRSWSSKVFCSRAPGLLALRGWRRRDPLGSRGRKLRGRRVLTLRANCAARLWLLSPSGGGGRGRESGCAPADSGFLSPQAGVFGSTSERAVADSAQVDRGRTTRLDLGFGNGTEDGATAARAEPKLNPSGGGEGAIRSLARPSRAELVFRGPSGPRDAGEAQLARAGKRVPFGVRAGKRGWVRGTSAR